MTESISLQVELSNHDVEVICWGKYKFSWYLSKHYGWTRKGYCGHKSVIPNKFRATFMSTFSSSKIFKVVANKETFEPERFCFFLSKIVVNEKNICNGMQ